MNFISAYICLKILNEYSNDRKHKDVTHIVYIYSIVASYTFFGLGGIQPSRKVNFLSLYVCLCMKFKKKHDSDIKYKFSSIWNSSYLYPSLEAGIMCCSIGWIYQFCMQDCMCLKVSYVAVMIERAMASVI